MKPSRRIRISLSVLRVYASPLDHTRGVLTIGPCRYPCALGRSGPVVAKREGDGGTPRARMRLVRLFYRADRGLRPRTQLPCRRIGPLDAWCDDPEDRRYNRLIDRPLAQTEERLWREDHLYDVLIELDWNRHPRVKGRGSAIFWHRAREGFKPTAGCIAVTPDTFRKLLPRLSRHTVLHVW